MNFPDPIGKGDRSVRNGALHVLCRSPNNIIYYKRVCLNQFKNVLFFLQDMHFRLSNFCFLDADCLAVGKASIVPCIRLGSTL